MKANEAKTMGESIDLLRSELTSVRKEANQAVRDGDFMKVARLTSRAAALNRKIMDAEADLLSAQSPFLS